MNANFIKKIVVVAFVSFAGTSIASESEPAVAVKTDGMSSHLAATIQGKAAEGFAALRQYVIRTRMIHALDLRSLIRDDAWEAARNAADTPMQVAVSTDVTR
jgi:hypothetical protein